jgi:hypothetical protein
MPFGMSAEKCPVSGILELFELVSTALVFHGGVEKLNFSVQIA